VLAIGNGNFWSPNFGVKERKPTITITGQFTTFTQGLTTPRSAYLGYRRGAVTVTAQPRQLELQDHCWSGARTAKHHDQHRRNLPGTFTVTREHRRFLSVTPNVGVRTRP